MKKKKIIKMQEKKIMSLQDELSYWQDRTEIAETSGDCIDEYNDELREENRRLKEEYDRLFDEYSLYKLRVTDASTAIISLTDLLAERLADGKDYTLDDVKKVAFDKTHSVIYWSDGTKTISECDAQDMENGLYDPKIGFLISLAKKAYGSRMVNQLLKKYFPTTMPKDEIVKDTPVKESASAAESSFAKESRNEPTVSDSNAVVSSEASEQE